MFALAFDALAASQSNLPFKKAFKRARCIRAGHKVQGSTTIDKVISEKHPHNDDDHVFCTYIRRCSCGVIFYENCLTFRRPLSEDFPRICGKR